MIKQQQKLNNNAHDEVLEREAGEEIHRRQSAEFLLAIVNNSIKESIIEKIV